MSEPLDRFLVRRCRWTWAAVHRTIQQQRVAIDGLLCKRYHHPLAAQATVTIDGVAIPDGPDTTTLVCHKAAGWACSHQSEHAPLIYDTVPPELRHPSLQTIGRLDRDTTGLLLLTLDGQLLQRIAQPRRRLWKRYHVTYDGQLASYAHERVAAGLPIADDPTPCLPGRFTETGPGQATLELREGRHHQVKRMIAALGGRVTALHRDRIGGLELPCDMAPGQMRPLTASEERALFADWINTVSPVDAPVSPRPS